MILKDALKLRNRVEGEEAGSSGVRPLVKGPFLKTCLTSSLSSSSNFSINWKIYTLDEKNVLDRRFCIRDRRWEIIKSGGAVV